ncbi:MAG: fibronectin type III domain-containing protein [Deltaproteobacteria bacterium]|nr:fibronectin type III domain-containing protein [Deltaproteobacteria bacterium]
MRPRLLAALLAAFLLLGAAPVLTVVAPVPDREVRLREAVAKGTLDDAHALLYRLYAQKAPERLPPEFQARVPLGALRAQSVEGAHAHRCGTLLLREVRARMASLPADVRAGAESLLLRPQVLARETGETGRAVSHSLDHWVTTEHFSIEWGDDLTNEDGTKPVRDADRDGVPDVVELWAKYFEATYRKLVVEMDYGDLAGPVLAQELIPVYIANSDPGHVFEDMSPGYYGETHDDVVPWIVVNNNMDFPGNADADPIQGAMKVTAAHEFFHVVQFLMPLPASWLWYEDDWWLEGSAVWAEDEVFDEVNDYFRYLQEGSGWPSYVEEGLPVSGLYAETNQIYGSAIFGKYLSEHTGGVGALASVWSSIRAGARPLVAFDQYAAGLQFDGLYHLFQGFAGANAVMDYRDGSHYGSVPLAKSGGLEVLNSGRAPDYLGATYLTQAFGDGNGVSVQLTGSPAAQWGLALCLLREEGYPLVLGAFGSTAPVSAEVGRFGIGDILYAIPNFLRDGVADSGRRYSTLSGQASPGTFAGAVTGLRADAAPGGLNVSWNAALASSGYVVRWKTDASAQFTSGRTIYGPVTRAELRGLQAGQTYGVEVFAYGPSGDEGGGAEVRQTVVSDGRTPTPEVAMTLGSGATTGGGGSSGGGGGGCFLTALGL